MAKDTKALVRHALRHFTQEELAKKMKATQPTVSRWNSGKAEMPYDRGKKLEGIIARAENRVVMP